MEREKGHLASLGSHRGCSGAGWNHAVRKAHGERQGRRAPHIRPFAVGPPSPLPVRALPAGELLAWLIR